MRARNIGRDPFARILRRYRHERHVARHTSRGRTGRRRADRLHHLHDLGIERLIGDTYRPQASPCSQRSIHGQQHPVPRPGEMRDPMIVALGVPRVEPQQPQPARQLSQHRVGKQPG
jgi:hypothetical protein